MPDDAVDVSADIAGQPAMKACEVAQAALFAAALDVAIADLRVRIEGAEQRWALCQSRASRAELEIPECLVRLHSQLLEATRLRDRCSRVAGS